MGGEYGKTGDSFPRYGSRIFLRAIGTDAAHSHETIVGGTGYAPTMPYRSLTKRKLLCTKGNCCVPYT